MVVCSGWLGGWTPRWTTTFPRFTKAGWSNFADQEASWAFTTGARTAATGCHATLRRGGFTSSGGGGFTSAAVGGGTSSGGGGGSGTSSGSADGGGDTFSSSAGGGRRHLLPSLLPGWPASRHVLAWGRSSWIHFLVIGDGGAGVFLVSRLTKSLASHDLYWQDGEPSGGRSHASEPMSAQESSWPQKESCGHKETCDCSYFIKNTKCPTTPMSYSILKKTMNCSYFY
jgi:hypothetical protein